MANYNGTPLVLGTVAALAVAASLGRRGSRAGPAVSDLKREWQHPLLPMMSDDLYRKISKVLAGRGWSEQFIADRLALGKPHLGSDVTFVVYTEMLATALDSQPVGNGWSCYGEYMTGSVSVMSSDSEWLIHATPGWEGEWRTLPIAISDPTDDGWTVDVPLFRKTLAGEKYLFNGDLDHDIKVWMDLVRPWTEAIDSSKIGTMLRYHGALTPRGRNPEELNEIAP
jgi:hypothetical protein